jgi:hypothetical protein
MQKSMLLKHRVYVLKNDSKAHVKDGSIVAFKNYTILKQLKEISSNPYEIIDVDINELKDQMINDSVNLKAILNYHCDIESEVCNIYTMDIKHAMIHPLFANWDRIPVKITKSQFKKNHKVY